MKERFANLVWNALTTSHSHFAQRHGEVIRYPAEVAPFCAVPNRDTVIDATPLLQQGDIYFLGIFPQIQDGPYHADTGTVLRMVYNEDALPTQPALRDESVELTIADSAEMVALTQLAFPGYFRPQTPLLGRYFGIRIDGVLVAMAGERLRIPGMFEISGVCTRPGYTGRGYARYLMQRLLCTRTGERAFLQVNGSNTRAIEIYRDLGFEPFHEVEALHLSS